MDVQGNVCVMKMLAKLRLFNPANTLKLVMFSVLLASIAGCSAKSAVSQLAPSSEQHRAEQLTRDITRLSPYVDPAEAAQAASIAIDYSYQLADEYEITQSPVMHNFLINIGVKQRGLCIHWTEDLQKRLQQEDFQSLEFHWAVANYDNPFRLEHSSVVVTPKGGQIKHGILLDPWRYGGRLYWNVASQDTGYQWFPRDVIRQKKLARRERLVEQPSSR